MKNDEIRSKINEAKGISELIAVINEISTQASSENVTAVARSVVADLKRIQKSAPELMQLAKLDPLVPGVNTPVNWTEFPGLSEKMGQLAKHQNRPTPLTRQLGKQDIKSHDAPVREAPAKNEKENSPRKKKH